MRISDLVNMLKRHAYTFDNGYDFDRYRKFTSQPDDGFELIGNEIDDNGRIWPMVAKFREHTEPGDEYILGDLSDIDKYSQDLIIRFALQDEYERRKKTKYNILTGEIYEDGKLKYSSYKKVKVNGINAYSISVCSSNELRQPAYQFTEEELQELLARVPDKELKLQIEMGLKEI